MRLLIDEQPLIVQPSLAVAIGLEEAVVLQQIHYHCKVRDPQMKEWLPCSVTTLTEWCPFITKRSMERILASLKTQGLVEVAQRPGFDRTNWLRVCYETLATISPNGGMHTAKMAGSHTAKMAASLIQGIKEEEEGANAPFAGLDEKAWSLWVQYRTSIKKPIKGMSIPAAQKKLAAFGDQQMAVVENAIANSYQGLFPVKGTPPAKPPVVKGGVLSGIYGGAV